MTTSVISSTTTDPSGAAVPSVTVVARLRPGAGIRVSDGTSIGGQVSTTSDSNGAWSLTLEQTVNVIPVGSFWEVEEQIADSSGGRRVSACIVGSSNATLNASLIWPPVRSGELTQALADLRYWPLGGSARLNDGNTLTLGTTGSGGPGNGAVAGQIIANVPRHFVQGTTLTGSNTTHAVVAGDMRAYVGFYYVAVGVTNNPSVPITSVTYDGTNSTIVIPFVTSHAASQAYEISFFPGGDAGHAGTNGVNAIYKPTRALTTVWQYGPNTAYYQVDSYGTGYHIRLNGTGANNGDFFTDFKFGDIGVAAIEVGGTPGDTSPAGTEASNTAGLLLYHQSSIKAFRSTNSPRTKSYSMDGATGDTSVWASAASSGVTKITSPKWRMVGTYWDGAASQDRVAYVQVDPTDTSGGVSVEWGFEHRGSPHIRLVDGTVAFLQPYADAAAGLGGTSNRWSQVIAAGASGQGFRVFNVGEANPVAEVNASGVHFGAGAGSATDVVVARAAAGSVMVPMLVKAGVPADGDFVSTPPNGTMAINSLTDVIYYRKAGVWTATTA